MFGRFALRLIGRTFLDGNKFGISRISDGRQYRSFGKISKADDPVSDFFHFDPFMTE
jgi:hypothetical protein